MGVASDREHDEARAILASDNPRRELAERLYELRSLEKRRARVQGFGTIPWEMHVRAWGVYAEKHGREQSPARIAERGGFSAGELDMFIPGWRTELTEIPALKKTVARLRQVLTTCADVLGGIADKSTDPAAAQTANLMLTDVLEALEAKP